MSTETIEKEMSPLALRVAAWELLKVAKDPDREASEETRAYCLQVAAFLKEQAQALKPVQDLRDRQAALEAELSKIDPHNALLHEKE